MRRLATIVVALLACSFATAADAPKKSTDPIAIIGVALCGEFLGSIIVMPDGTLQPLDPTELPLEVGVKIAAALGHGHNAFVKVCKNDGTST